MASPRTRRVLKDLKIKDDNNVSCFYAPDDRRVVCQFYLQACSTSVSKTRSPKRFIICFRIVLSVALTTPSGSVSRMAYGFAWNAQANIGVLVCTSGKAFSYCVSLLVDNA
jgi:hypothetical protein